MNTALQLNCRVSYVLYVTTSRLKRERVYRSVRLILRRFFALND